MVTRVFPPPTGGKTTVAFGRTYSGPVAGVSQDVPNDDATVLSANGWVWAAYAETTVNRLALKAKRNTLVFDTTLGHMTVWDGANWRKIADGSIV
jgi:hypothetical protein